MKYAVKNANQIRWSDSKRLQEAIQGMIAVVGIDFQIETQSIPFKDNVAAQEIRDTMKFCAQHNVPMVLYDVEYGSMYMTTEIQGEDEFILASAYIYGNRQLHITYDNNVLDIESTSEDFIPSDYVKTLFGNQSIIGSGNIDLYNHFLTITLADGSNLYMNYYSSNRLVVDSLQDLTALTKAVSGTKLAIGNTYITFTNNVWKTANSTLITKVADVITTI